MQRSQSGEDVILFDMLYKGLGRRGVFLEIGAFDGERFSNSYYYEHALGWKGLLIEAHPMNAVKLFQANRPRSARFAAAACPLGEDGGAGSVVFSETGGEVAAAREAASPEFKEKWVGQLGQGNVSVPCVPLQLLIDSTGLWDVDLFSLDVEGSEWAVLSTVDLRVTNVRAFIVELDGSNPDKDEKVCLTSHGGEERGLSVGGRELLASAWGRPSHTRILSTAQTLSRAMRSHSLTLRVFLCCVGAGPFGGPRLPPHAPPLARHDDVAA
jgi:FkbM family methyltransferase